MFGWFNSGEAKSFGLELAQFFIEKLPPTLQLNESKLSSKTQYVLDKIGSRVKEFRQHHELNTLRRAKLANAFRWKLMDAGYDKAYVEMLVAWLVAKL